MLRIFVFLAFRGWMDGWMDEGREVGRRIVIPMHEALNCVEGHRQKAQNLSNFLARIFHLEESLVV
jgi:hypothetical protein